MNFHERWELPSEEIRSFKDYKKRINKEVKDHFEKMELRCKQHPDIFDIRGEVILTLEIPTGPLDDDGSTNTSK